MIYRYNASKTCFFIAENFHLRLHVVKRMNNLVVITINSSKKKYTIIVKHQCQLKRVNFKFKSLVLLLCYCTKLLSGKKYIFYHKRNYFIYQNKIFLSFTGYKTYVI